MMKLLMTLVVTMAMGLLFVGCAVDPSTGKSKFDPGEAVKVTESPAAVSVASTLPYGLGALGLSALTLLFSHMAGSQKTQALERVATSVGAKVESTPNTAAPPKSSGT